jgi:hypothetical protein
MGLLRGYEAISQRGHAATRALGAASACLLLGLLGAGLAVRGAHGAGPARVLTDPPPTTTIPVTTTAPAPDPAPPPPKPKPKPKPKPAPKPAPSPAPHVTTTPHVVHSTPSLTPAVQKVTPKVVRPKHKKARAKPHVVAKVKPKPKPNALPPQVPVGAESAAASSSGTRPSLTSTLIIGILGISMMVFAVAAIPARVVPWRNVAYFIHQRHVDLTLFGIVLLAAAALAILFTKG